MTKYFLFIDIVKGALLKRMEREVCQIMTDTFLTFEQQTLAVTLYERIGNDFVEAIKTLHKVKTPELLFVLATNVVNAFCYNLDRVWVFAYDGKLDKPIHWLSETEVEHYEFT